MAVFLRGSSYYLKIRCEGRQVLRSLLTGDAVEAMARAATLQRSLGGPLDTIPDTRALFLPPKSADRQLLSSLFHTHRDRIAQHVTNGHLRPSYGLEADSLWKAHLERYAHRIVDAQLNALVIDYLNGLALSASRRRKIHKLLRDVARTAIADTWVDKKVQFKSVRPLREKRPLTVAQLQSCKDACLRHPHPISRLIYLAAVTGARIGEMMALQPSDIGADYISITKTKCRKTGAVLACKTRNSRRVIPVAPHILATVQPCIGNPGKEWFPVWRCVRKQAGIGTVGIHVLRHTWATQAFASGMTPKAVSLALGHASVTFTETQYARFLTADAFKDELAAFNA